jgi:5-methylcytosine-specific restriction protein A
LVLCRWIEPFHLNPARELDPTNFITLCESAGHNCHLIFGHLLAWASWNASVLADAAAYRSKLLARPTNMSHA